MEIITVTDELRDGTGIYEVTQYEKHLMYAERNAIAEYAEVDASQIFDGKKTKGFEFRLVGYSTHLFKYAGHVGTREELKEKLNIKGAVSKIVKRHMQIDDSLQVNGEPATITPILEFYKRMEKEPVAAPKVVEQLERIVPKFKYKGENKRYVDSLLNNCFKGWRA